MYDLDALKADINLKKILPSILCYDEIKYAGSTMYCKCVSGLHEESQYNHCAVSEKYVHCFSCGANYDAFEYIKKYYEQQGFNLKFAEICEKIGDALGGATYYKTDKKAVKKVEMPLTAEEFAVIGIHTSSKKGAPSLQKMYEEAPRKTKDLIRDKAYESMIKYKALAEQLDKPLSERYLELYRQARDIYEKLGGENSPTVRLFKV